VANSTYRLVAWDVSRLAGRFLSASEVVGYVAVGATAILGRSLRDVVREALAWVLPRNSEPRRQKEADAANGEF
jgi:hypothetical protein